MLKAYQIIRFEPMPGPNNSKIRGMGGVGYNQTMFKKKKNIVDLSRDVASIIYETRVEGVSGFEKIVGTKYPSYTLNEEQKVVVELWQLSQTLLPLYNSPDQTVARKIISSIVLEYSKLSGYSLEKVGSAVREFFEDFEKNYSPKFAVSPTKYLMRRLGWDELTKDPFLMTGIEVSSVGTKKWIAEQFKS